MRLIFGMYISSWIITAKLRMPFRFLPSVWGNSIGRITSSSLPRWTLLANQSYSVEMVGFLICVETGLLGTVGAASFTHRVTKWVYFIFIHLIFMSHIVLYFYTQYSGTLLLYRRSFDTLSSFRLLLIKSYPNYFRFARLNVTYMRVA